MPKVFRYLKKKGPTRDFQKDLSKVNVQSVKSNGNQASILSTGFRKSSDLLICIFRYLTSL